jgi:hypothetical protein
MLLCYTGNWVLDALHLKEMLSLCSQRQGGGVTHLPRMLRLTLS